MKKKCKIWSNSMRVGALHGHSIENWQILMKELHAKH